MKFLFYLYLSYLSEPVRVVHHLVQSPLVQVGEGLVGGRQDSVAAVAQQQLGESRRLHRLLEHAETKRRKMLDCLIFFFFFFFFFFYRRWTDFLFMLVSMPAVWWSSS